jgi:hypothetical protein
VRRADELAARRRALLAQCDAQRAELEYRFAHLRPGRWARAAAVGIAGGGLRRVVGRHPLAWIALLGSFLVLGRTREVLTLILWARSALSVVSRATRVMGLVGSLRRTRARARS